LGKLKKDWSNNDCHFERRNFRKRKRKSKKVELIKKINFFMTSN